MSDPLVLTCTVHFRRHGRRAAKAHQPKPHGQVPATPVSFIPRLARLMALAIHLDELVQTGAVPDYATLARLGHVSRARITQILNLAQLAPDIQEELLFLDPDHVAAARLTLRTLQPLTALLDWRQQRRAWRKLHAYTAQPA